MKVIELNKHIITEIPVVEGSFSENSEKKKILNYDIVSASLEYLHTKYRKDHTFIMEGMQKLSNMYTDGFFEVINNVNEINSIIKNELTPFDSKRMVLFRAANFDTGLNSIDGPVNNISNSCDSAINSCKGIADQLNPMSESTDMTSFLKAMASFLVCPEMSFLNDLMNAVGNIIDEVKNFRPQEILNELTNQLSDFVADVIDEVGLRVADMVDSMQSYFLTEFPIIGEILATIDDVLNKFNETWDFLLGLPIIGDLFRDLKERKDIITNGNIDSIINNIVSGNSNNDYLKYPDWTLPITKYPEPIDNSKCRHMIKKMNQLDNSFRSNNRFDYYNMKYDMVSGISDPNISKQVKDYINYEERIDNQLLVKKNATDLGYKGNTAYNSSLSTLMKSTSLLRENKRMLSDVNTKDDLDVVCIQIQKNNDHIITSMNEEIIKQNTLSEALNNLERENNFYDFAGIK